MKTMLLWNVINLLDGEASWFLTFLLILTIAAVTTHLWNWLCVKMQKKFLRKNELLKNATLEASILPVSCYIWFITAILSLDLVSDQFLSEGVTNGLKFGFGVAAVVVLAWFLLRANKGIRIILLQKSRNREITLDPGKVYGLAKLATVVILVLSAILLMEVTGVNINTLIAFGGISGLALAFASQEIIANFFGGIMIYINQPFAVGDYIGLPSVNLDGVVEEIGWYETSIRGKDKQAIYIPNALFSKAYVLNWQRRTHRRINEIISIRHQDLAQSAAIIEEIRKFLQTHGSVDSSQSILVYISLLAPSSIDITITCLSTIINEPEFLQFRDAFFVNAATIIKAHGAEIAVPVLKGL